MNVPTEPSPEKLMDHALAVAERAKAYGDVPIGAVLWVEGRIVAGAFNSRECAHSALGHAELDLIRHYNQLTQSWRLPPNAVVAVTAEPCLMCTGALLQARVAKLIYGCADTKNAGLRLVQPQIEKGTFDHRMEIVSGVQAEKCASLLSQFFQARRGKS